MESESKLAITYDPSWLGLWTQRFDDPLIDAETFRLDENNNLVEIGNVPKSIEEVQGQYMGLLRFTPTGWEEVQRIRRELTPLELNKIHMTGILQKVIEANNIQIKAIPYLDKWGEVDTQEDLSIYQNGKS